MGITSSRFIFLFALLAAIGGVFVTPSIHAGTPPDSSDQDDNAFASQVVAYYFFTDVRCATCRKLEAYSEEAITQAFAEERAAGRLVWRAVNTDEEQHAHFVKDFGLVTKSVVLVEYHGDTVARYENLNLIWQKVRDKESYLAYVRDATRRFMDGS